VARRGRAGLRGDEAQEMMAQVLSELRLWASSSFDSQSLLCIVMAGDARLIEKLRREELIPCLSGCFPSVILRSFPGHARQTSISDITAGIHATFSR